MVKKIKNKVASCVLSAALLSSAALPLVSAANDPQFVLSNVSGYVGEEVTVSLDCTNNPGITAWKVEIEYDSNALQLESYDIEGVFGEAVPSETIDENPFVISWNNDVKDITVNGRMADLNFKIKENAVAGDYDVKLTYDEDNVYSVKLNEDGDETNIHFEIVNSKVTVKEKSVPVKGIELSQSNIELTAVNDTAEIKPILTPNNATNQKVLYQSDNTDVATVDANGIVTAKANGKANITVSTEDGGYSAVCVVNVTIPHKHEMTVIPEKVPTCVETGNNKYYYCAGCEKYFKDKNGDVETSQEDEILDKVAHDFSAENNADKYLKEIATCGSKAVYYYSCSVCGEIGAKTFEYGDVDKNNHVGQTKVENQKEATCDEPGYTGDTVCVTCGEIINAGTIIEANGHTPSNVWSTDATSHWKTCTVGCGTIIDKADHKGGTATCHTKAVCEVCNAEYGEYDKSNHDGDTIVKNAVEPTADNDGYTGDVYCASCDELISEGSVIPKTTEEPQTEEPVTEEPQTEEPVTEEPQTEEPATEEPQTEEPATEEPMTEEPQTEEPASEEIPTQTPVEESSEEVTGEFESEEESVPEESSIDNEQQSSVESANADSTENQTKTNETSQSSTNENTPSTGDSGYLVYVLIMLASLVGITLVFKKKRI